MALAARPGADLVGAFADAAALLARVDVAVERVGPGLARLLSLAEATSSSAIEGLTVSVEEVAVARAVRHRDATARLVAANADLVLRAATLPAGEPLTVEVVAGLQEGLLPRLAGLREGAVWVGGHLPAHATFVPPPAELVPDLLADAVEYASSPTDSPLVAAALAHAAFETVHPFRDGNGRTGRALVAAVLARGGYPGGALVPLSARLLSDRRLTGGYYDALRAWRVPGEEGTYYRLLADALEEGATEALRVAAAVERLRDGDRARLASHRRDSGSRSLRGDSVASRLVDELAGHPVLTTASTTALLGVSRTSAYVGLDLLVDAGALLPREVPGVRGLVYVAHRYVALARRAFENHAGTHYPGEREHHLAVS